LRGRFDNAELNAFPAVAWNAVSLSDRSRGFPGRHPPRPPLGAALS
jgi:hypothetical protein